MLDKIILSIGYATSLLILMAGINIYIATTILLIAFTTTIYFFIKMMQSK